MLIPMLLIANQYYISKRRTILISIILTICGAIGTYIWFFVESGRFGGRSFFGAVFIVPICFIPISKLLRIRYGELMDMCAPAEMMMLVLMKVLCMMEDCCKGRPIFFAESGNTIYFPSQLIEMINAFLLVLILLYIAKCGKWKWFVYPWYLVLYGLSRFVLNFFRNEWLTTEMIVPFGTIWSLVSIFIGLALLKKWRSKFAQRTFVR